MSPKKPVNQTDQTSHTTHMVKSLKYLLIESGIQNRVPAPGQSGQAGSVISKVRAAAVDAQFKVRPSSLA